jgi:hypothetical protein
MLGARIAAAKRLGAFDTGKPRPRIRFDAGAILFYDTGVTRSTRRDHTHSRKMEDK